MSEKVYELKLHEEIEVTEMVDVRRVPGGWIYLFYSGDDNLSPVFVPFNNEFMEARNK